jgi:hypothetical protein
MYIVNLYWLDTLDILKVDCTNAARALSEGYLYADKNCGGRDNLLSITAYSREN